MPESFAGYGDCGTARVDRDTGGLGAGRLGIKLGWSFAECIAGLFPGMGTGGGERGFSKVPSSFTVGNLGLAGGLLTGDIPAKLFGAYMPGDGATPPPPEGVRSSGALTS